MKSLNVLVSGSTNADLGELSLRRGYLTAIELLVKALREMGHNVTRRRIMPGETLKEFDKVLIGLYAPLGFAASDIHSALWGLTVRPDSIALINDWQISYTYSSLEFVLRHPNYLLKTPMKRNDREDWMKYEDKILKGTEMIARTGKRIVFVPAFPWGDRSLFPFPEAVKPAMRFYDPSPIVKLDQVIPPWTRRERQWVFAALADHTKWVEKMDLMWPVIMLGNKKADYARVSEPEVIRLMASTRGAISFPYQKHSGSGWWRARIVYAAHLSTVLLCDPSEATPMGKPYSSVADEPWQLERAPDDSQRYVAQRQKQHFFQNSWTHSELYNAITGLFKEVN